MKEVKNDIIKKLVYKDYVVYIKETNDCYESYLQNEKYGIIDFMFGVKKDANCLKDYIKLVNSNINDYIDLYKEKYIVFMED